MNSEVAKSWGNFLPWPTWDTFQKLLDNPPHLPDDIGVFSCKKSNPIYLTETSLSKMVQSVENKLKKRIYAHGRGWVFTPKRFLSLGSRQAVDIALFRLAREGTIRRLSRGLYDYPETHPKLGRIFPALEKVVDAIRESARIRVQPGGAYATNLLGLSEQVPAKVMYITDGPSRKVKIGKLEIRLMQTTPANMASAGKVSGLLIQAFKYLGKQHVTPERIRHLRKRLSADEKVTLQNDIGLASTWMHPYIREITKE